MHLGSVSAKCAKCSRLCTRGGSCKGLATYDRIHCQTFLVRLTTVLYSGGEVRLILTTKRDKMLFRKQAQQQ